MNKAPPFDENLERNLLDQAVQALHAATGVRLRVVDERGLAGGDYDATLQLEGGRFPPFFAQVKRWAQNTHPGLLVNRIRQLPGMGLLVADYINPNMADRLREADVQFIDAAGNAYINAQPIYIFIKGVKKAPDHPAATRVPEVQARGRAFQTAGLKLMYAMLVNRELVNAPYRDMARVAGVAVGTVGLTIKELKLFGFLVEYGDGHRKLQNVQTLFDRWVDTYIERLRPKLFLGTFSAGRDNWWLDLDEGILDYHARWGGEVAVAKRTGYLKPETVVVYLDKKAGSELLRDFQFRKDPHGRIQLFRAFWNEDKRFVQQQHMHNALNGTAHPIIVYADLLASDDPRNIEAAGLFYEKEIAGLIDSH